MSSTSAPTSLVEVWIPAPSPVAAAATTAPAPAAALPAPPPAVPTAGTVGNLQLARKYGSLTLRTAC